MYQPGQSIRIIRNEFAEEGSRNFVGQTGTVNTVTPSGVTVTQLNGPNNTETYWFTNSEIEPA